MSKHIYSLCLICILLIGGCSHSHLNDNFSDTTGHFYAVTGVVQYYDYSQDRGEGIADGKSYGVSLHVHSGNAITGAAFIVDIGCVVSIGLDTLIRPVRFPGEKVACTPGYCVGSGYTFSLDEKPLLALGQNLSGSSISAQITKPLDMRPLVGELPDRHRSGSCEAYSDIKDIYILD